MRSPPGKHERRQQTPTAIGDAAFGFDAALGQLATTAAMSSHMR